MAKNSPDERLVYLALKNVFKGNDAQVRNSKTIRKIIQKQQKDINVQTLVHAHNIDNICNVAKSLLEQQIFESTLKAKIRFPEVFEVSPAQSAERATSEAEAARTEADAIKGVAEGHDGALALTDTDEPEPVDQAQRKYASQLRKRPILQTTSSIPSLYPVYLPYHTQHELLTRVQRALETACYAFGRKSLVDIMVKEGWDCAESVELNQWTKLLFLHQNKCSAPSLQTLVRPLKEILDSVTQLRHTAVHRIKVSANRLESFLADSEILARLLEDNECTLYLARLQQETSVAVEELKRNKDLLEVGLGEELKKIAAKRADLERLENEAIRDMLAQDREYQSLAGESLDQAIISTETAVQSSGATEDNGISDADFDEQDTGQLLEKPRVQKDRDDWEDSTN